MKKMKKKTEKWSGETESGTREALEASELFCSARRFQNAKNRIEISFCSANLFGWRHQVRDLKPRVVREINFNRETRPPHSNRVQCKNPKLSYKEPRVAMQKLKVF